MKRPLGFAGLLLAGACTVTRPLPVALDASALRAFLAEHPQADLRVVEHSGKRYWIHRPAVKGDSLVGRRGYDVPVQPLSVPLGSVAELDASHFSLDARRHCRWSPVCEWAGPGNPARRRRGRARRLIGSLLHLFFCGA